jgi:galacturonosyltransferase
MANVILEASSAGRPSIVSNIPGCKEAVVDNETGFLFKKSDSIEIFDSMKKMIKLSNKEREIMGQKARNLMINNFEKKMIVNKTIQLIFRDII